MKIRELRLCVPPVEDQSKIVEHLDARCAELRKLSDNIEKQIDTLLAYRASLIHECVTGQRRITDADIRKVEADVTSSYAHV